MREQTKYMVNKFSNNLKTRFSGATAAEITAGLIWYDEGRAVCKDIAKVFNTDTLTAAGVIAALSPRNKWSQNIKDAYKVFAAVRAGKGPDQIKVCTFNKNKVKAFNIALGVQAITDKSLKTFNFVHNLASESNNFVTVDIWHLRACLGKSIKIDNAAVGRLAYEQIKQLTLKNAAAVGLKGYQYQAIIWLTTQNNYKN